MSDPNNGPVSLASGSYDYDQLKTGLDKAAKAKEADYKEGVDKALTGAATSVHQNNDPRTIPGYKFVDVQNEELGVTERVQVFDEKLADKQDEAAGSSPESETPTTARRAAKASTEE